MKQMIANMFQRKSYQCMKRFSAVRLVLLSIFLCSGLAAQTTSSDHIKKLMDAVEERHAMVEEAMATSFKLMNDYHAEMMSVDGVVRYSDQDGVTKYEYRDSILGQFKKPDAPAMLGEDDYVDTANPLPRVYFYTTGNRATAVAAKNADIAVATSALSTKQDEIYLYSDGFHSSASAPSPDYLAYAKAYFEWKVAARKQWIETGTKKGAFPNTLQDYLVDFGAHPDTATRNQKHQADWQDVKDREIDVLEYNLQSYQDADLKLDTQENRDAYDADIAQWITQRAQWVQTQNSLAEQNYIAEVNTYLQTLPQKLNNPVYRKKAEKLLYLMAVKSRLRKILEELPSQHEFSLSSDSLVDASFDSVTINWIYEDPQTMKQQIAVLNQIVKELDRLAPSYIALESKDTLVSKSFASPFRSNASQGLPSIGLVNETNYQSKMLQIQRRLNDMKALKWPSLAKNYSIGSREKDVGNLSTINLGENASNALSPRRHLNSEPFTPVLGFGVHFEHRWGHNSISTYAEYPYVLPTSDEWIQMSYGNASGMVTYKPSNSSVYMFYNQSNGSLFNDGVTQSGRWNVRTFNQFTQLSEVPGVNFAALVEQETNLYDTPTDVSQAFNKVEVSRVSWDRNYPDGATALGLVESLSLPVNVSISTFAMGYDFKQQLPVRSYIPADRIDLDSERNKQYAISGTRFLVCYPDFQHTFTESYYRKNQSVPSIGFGYMENEATSPYGLILSLPNSREGDVSAPYVELPLISASLEYAAHNRSIPISDNSSTFIFHYYNYNFLYPYREYLVDVKTHRRVFSLADMLEVRGNLLDVEVEREGTPHTITSWKWDNNGQWDSSSTIDGTLAAGSEFSNFDRAAETQSISRVNYDGGYMQIESIDHYQMKIKCYLDGTATPVRTYDISVGGAASNEVINKLSYNSSLKYPQGFETIMVKVDGDLWAKLVATTSDSQVQPTSGEFCKIEYYNDGGSVESSELIKKTYDSNIEYSLRQTTAIHTQSDNQITTATRIGKKILPSNSWEELLLTLHSYQARNISYTDVTVGSASSPSDFVELDDEANLISIARNFTQDYKYTAAYKNADDNSNWTHLPWMRYPKSQTFNGAGWAADGDTIEYDQSGQVTKATSTIAGMDEEILYTRADNVVTIERKVKNQLLSTRTVNYENGLSKITTTVDGVDSVVEFYTEGAFAWYPKKVTSLSGDTAYTYTKQPDGGMKSVSISTPVSGSSSPTTTTTILNKYGKLVSSEVKSGGKTISKTEVTDYKTPFGLPGRITSTAGGVTKFQDYEYDTEGRLKQTTSSDNEINSYEWDILGRLKDGTKFDGLTYTPHYNGFESGSTFAGYTTTTETDAYGRVNRHEVDRIVGGADGAEYEYSSSSLTQSSVMMKEDDSTIDGVQVSSGQHSATNTFLPDGLPEEFSGGMGSPGMKYIYDVETVDGTPCLTVKTIALNSGGGETGTWSKKYIDGYGRTIRVETPNPNGTTGANVYTTYNYNISARSITVTRPPPSLPLQITYSEDWRTATYTVGNRVSTVSSEMVEGVLKNTMTYRGREVGYSETDLTSGASMSRTNGRNPVTSTISADGNEVTVKDEWQSESTMLFDKDGLESATSTVNGVKDTLKVGRDDYGGVASLIAKSDGIGGEQMMKYTREGRLASITGDGVDASFSETYSQGGYSGTATDTATGISSSNAVDQFGNPGAMTSTGRTPTEYTGSILDGSLVYKPTSAPDGYTREVHSTYGPTLQLLQKVRVDGSSSEYTYHPNGSLASFINKDNGANGSNASYAFNLLTNPSNGLSAGLSGPGVNLNLAYDSSDRVSSITFNSTDADGQNVAYGCTLGGFVDDVPTEETHSGILNAYKVKRIFDTNTGILTRVELRKGLALIHAVDYGIDMYGRVESISASEGKNFQSSLIYNNKGVLWATNSGAVSAQKTYSNDGTARLESMVTSVGNRQYSAVWRYNNKQRREGLDLKFTGIFRPDIDWSYSYDANHQLQAATSNILGDIKTYNYAHDVLGNRAGTQVNAQNQYQVLTVPGEDYYYVRGKVAVGTHVTVKRGDGDREAVQVDDKGFFFARYEAPAAGVDPQNIPIEVLGTIGFIGDEGRDAQAQAEQVVTLRPASWSLAYGTHGALAKDWRWDYTWNSQGRLIGMTTSAEALTAGTPDVKLKFSYDHKGRRIYKEVQYPASPGILPRTVITKFVYDGWDLLAEITTDSATGDTKRRFYTWGVDMDGSFGGLGGVGGLLAIHEDGETYVPVYDGVGNIIALCESTTGKEVAHWERGAFGELLDKSGHTELCPFGFATHYTDAETGLVYFGYRYYDPLSGRWLSKEPLGEEESFNLYAYCHNDPIHKVDYLGLATLAIEVGEDISIISAYKAPKISRTLTSTEILGVNTRSEVSNETIYYDRYKFFSDKDFEEVKLSIEIGRSLKKYLATRANEEKVFNTDSLWANKNIANRENRLTPAEYMEVGEGLGPNVRIIGSDPEVNRLVRHGRNGRANNHPWRGLTPVGFGYYDGYGWHPSFCLSCHGGHEGARLKMGVARNGLRESWSYFALSETRDSLFGLGAGKLVSKTGQSLKSLITASNNVVAANAHLVGKGDNLLKAIPWIKPKKGVYDVLIHGSDDAFHVLHNGKWVQLNQRSLATFMKSNGYNGGPVRLLSCSSGACPTGVAKNLSNKLGANVTAPSDTLWIHSNGKLTIGPNATSNTGVWNTFTPGK